MVIGGRCGMQQITMPRCRHGLRPCSHLTPDTIDIVMDIWSGQHGISFGFSEEGTWCATFCEDRDPLRIPAPTIPQPPYDYLPPPKALPVTFVERAPIEFVEVADPRNANWEEFVPAVW